jgi:hypothetical protein
MKRCSARCAALWAGALLGSLGCDKQVPLALPTSVTDGAAPVADGAPNEGGQPIPTDLCTLAGGQCVTQCATSPNLYSGFACGAGTVCCQPPPPSDDGGTPGRPCVAACNGTDNCEPGQYCPNNCLMCPCSSMCMAQSFACTYGQDQTCNDNPAISALHGHCVKGMGPTGTWCECNSGFAQNPQTGRCL